MYTDAGRPTSVVFRSLCARRYAIIGVLLALLLTGGARAGASEEGELAAGVQAARADTAAAHADTAAAHADTAAVHADTAAAHADTAAVHADAADAGSMPSSVGDLAAVGVTYRLEATWENEPWELTAGRYGHVADVSSAPDGTVFVLDARHGAVHVLARDGAPRTVFLVPDVASDWFVVRRLDAGPGGTVHVMSDALWQRNGRYRTRVDHLARDGTHIERMELETLRPSEYRDIAVDVDGRVYLSRMEYGSLVVFSDRPSMPEGNGVDVFRPYGALVERIESDEIVLPDSIDVDADGTLYVVNKVPGVFRLPPRPPPTPPPSVAEPDGRHGPGVEAAREPWPGQAPTQAPTQAPGAGPVEGVIVFGPDRRARGVVPFTGADDVTAGDAGVFVSRNTEVFALGEGEPLYRGPRADVYIGAVGNAVLRLDAPAGGHFLASMAHCYFQGLLILRDPSERPATGALVGELDQPDLAGPPYPLRLAAGRQVAVLQGRFGETETTERQRFTTNAAALPQTVQRWSRLGAVQAERPLVSQLGACSGSDDWWVRDVALDGDVVYTADADIVRQRPDDGLPSWSSWPAGSVDPDAGSRLTAIDARGGRVAVLDGGADAVYLLDADGNVDAHWPIGPVSDNATPIDIALGSDRVYLADRGRARIEARRLDGLLDEAWRTHDGPSSIAVGPSGHVFMLGRGGWGYRYSGDGILEAAWPMPDRGARALDISVDVDGRVYVSYAVFEPFSGVPMPIRGQPLKLIARSGVWVFGPAPAESSPPPDAGTCVASPEKVSGPARIPLGATVEVALSVEGRCPGTYEPVQIALVFDTSRSMNLSGALGRAKDAALALLAELDLGAAEIALVRFDDGAVLEVPLTRDAGEVATSVAALEAWGDTRLTAAIETAAAELTGPRGDGNALQIMLIVTDGVLKDSPLDAAVAARSGGIELRALVLPTSEFDPANLAIMHYLTGDPTLVVLDPDTAHLGDLARSMVRYREQPGLFETITVKDSVPGNMRYVVGSANPPASWDPTSRILTWRFGSVQAAKPLSMAYRLRPLAVGTWPTNVVASAAYRDALGNDGRLAFPIPEVEVYGLGYQAFVSYSASGACLRRSKPIDVVLAMDTSSSMDAPAAVGGTKLHAAQAAARTFLEQLGQADHGALVSFDSAARRDVGLTGDHAAVVQALERLTTTRGTRLELGLAEARRTLTEQGRPDATAVVVLLTDGLSGSGPEPVRAEAAALREAGVMVFAIGLGAVVDAELLREVATTREAYFASPSAADLASIYRQISERLACGRP